MAVAKPKDSMTIYDADYLPDYIPPGVQDFAAESQAVRVQEQEAPEAIQDQIADSSKMVDEVSEKEFNFKALRDSIAQEKAEREAERHRYQQELENMRAQIANSREEPRKGALDDLADDDLMTVEKFRQVQQEQQERYQEELNTLRYENLENRARLQHSDYNDVMEKYSIPLLRNNRDFARAFQNAENPAEFAYEIGRMQMNSMPKQPSLEPQISQKAERIVENARKPGTLSSARGGQPSLSKADFYASMSEKDFQDMVAKNLEEV